MYPCRPMSDVKPKFANFPERELKVAIGPNINAGTTKTLTRMSIGTYEMSFTQQEKGTATAEAARQAMGTLARAMGLTAASTPVRDYVSCHTAQNAEHKFMVWVTTPFEPTQANHIVWTKYVEVGGEGKVGVAFKLANAFTVDDIIAVLKKAQDNAVKLGADEPFMLKGNPPPRFQKKAKPAETPADAPAEPNANA
jgi:hypothetical protein